MRLTEKAVGRLGGFRIEEHFESFVHVLVHGEIASDLSARRPTADPRHLRYTANDLSAKYWVCRGCMRARSSTSHYRYVVLVFVAGRAHRQGQHVFLRGVDYLAEVRDFPAQSVSKLYT